MEILLILLFTIIPLILLMTGVTFYSTSKESWYGSVAAILKSKEAKIATKNILRETLHKKSITEALSTLMRTELGNYISKRVTEETHYQEIERITWYALSYDLSDLEKLLQGTYKEAFEAFMYRYDIYNIKSMIRTSFFKGRKVSLIPLGNLINLQNIEKFETVKALTEIVRLLEAEGYYREARLIEAYIPRLEARDVTAVILLEKELVKYWYEKILNVISKTSNPVLLNVAGMLIDMDFILSVIRFIHAEATELKENIVDLTYNLTSEDRRRLLESKSIDEVLAILQQSPYKSIIDDILKQELHKEPLLLDLAIRVCFIKHILSSLLGDLFNIKPLITYLLLKELEIHTLLLIFKVIFLNLPRSEYEKIVHLYPL